MHTSVRRSSRDAEQKLGTRSEPLMTVVTKETPDSANSHVMHAAVFRKKLNLISVCCQTELSIIALFTPLFLLSPQKIKITVTLCYMDSGKSIPGAKQMQFVEEKVGPSLRI